MTQPICPALTDIIPLLVETLLLRWHSKVLAVHGHEEQSQAGHIKHLQATAAYRSCTWLLAEMFSLMAFFRAVPKSLDAREP
jgi:hypothetical protein